MDSKVRWAPSIFRNKFGKADHALVDCIWKWRLRVDEVAARVDYTALAPRRSTSRAPAQTPSTHVEKFNAEVGKLLSAPSGDSEESKDEKEKTTEELYMDWCKAVREAAKTTLPKRKQASLPMRDVSDRTRRLYDIKANMRKSKHTRQEYSSIQLKIRQSSLQDFQDWVQRNVEEMERANERGDTKRIFSLHNHLAATPKPPPRNLTKHKSGDLIKSSEELAMIWYDFLRKKFSQTDAEVERPQMPPIPSERSPEDALKRAEFDVVVSKMPDRKAVGPDGVPAEAFKYSTNAKSALFEIINKMWDEEMVPTSFAKANFKMLFKKGNPDDPSKYRCLGMLNHCYKVLSRIILGRLVGKSERYLQDWQAGFRQARGCRDNSYILRVLCERMLQLGEEIAITFIDYTAAFDSVSHKFLDAALQDAGASNKVRAMFRAIYLAASAHTTVPAPEGETTKSECFAIRRGVVQGDITSPLYFIIALEAILRKHDSAINKGVPLGDVLIHTLGYADDAALVDLGNPNGIQTATSRVTAVAKGSRADTDMEISIPKTKVLHVRRQEQVTDTTATEARAVCKFTCPHLNCGFKFHNRRGMQIHASKCEHKNDLKISKILDCKGEVCSRKYLIRWENYPEEEDSWEPRGNLHPYDIRMFEIKNGRYVHDWQHRCDVCDLPCRSAIGVRVHKSRVHKAEKKQEFKGRLADGAVKVKKWTQLQSLRPKVECEGQQLQNVFKFKYLGTILAADGRDDYDISNRITKAQIRCGQLRNMFQAEHLSTQLKVRLYIAAVGSLLTYGSETWDLNRKVQRKLNGANSLMLASFTGKTIREEARPETTSFNLVRSIRVRRFRWLGHILRGGEERLVYAAMKAQSENGKEGNLLMDAPQHQSIYHLQLIAKDKAHWRALERNIGSGWGPHTT